MTAKQITDATAIGEARWYRCLENFGDAVGLNGMHKNFIKQHNMRSTTKPGFFCDDPYRIETLSMKNGLHPEFHFAYPIRNVNITIEDIAPNPKGGGGEKAGDKNQVPSGKRTVLWNAKFNRLRNGGKYLPGNLRPNGGEKQQFVKFCAAAEEGRRIAIKVQGQGMNGKTESIDEVMEYMLTFRDKKKPDVTPCKDSPPVAQTSADLANSQKDIYGLGAYDDDDEDANNDPNGARARFVASFLALQDDANAIQEVKKPGLGWLNLTNGPALM